MLEILITSIHVVTALFMVLVVLLQGGSQGGVGAAFGGGNSQGLFGATGATSFLGKLTYGAALIFMVTSITLTIQQGKSGKVGLKERLSNGSTPVPAETLPASSQPTSPVSEGAQSSPAPAASTAPAGTEGAVGAPGGEPAK
jgi:preprotein translocase subunit SecG